MHTAVREKSYGWINFDKRTSTGRKFMGNPMRLMTKSRCGLKKKFNQGKLSIHGKDHTLLWPGCPK